MNDIPSNAEDIFNYSGIKPREVREFVQKTLVSCTPEIK